MKSIFISIAMVVISFIAAQQNPEKYGLVNKDLPEGLGVGETAPLIEATDQNGDKFELREALKEGAVVLTFYRGNWCPYCSRYLASFSEAIKDIESAGGIVVAVSPEVEAEVAIASVNSKEGNLTMLHDADGKIMRAYNVDFKVTRAYQDKLSAKFKVNLKEHNNQDTAVLPVPATYIINKDGAIIYRYFNLDYSRRAPIEELLRVLKEAG
ncbi:MAG: peroxiredoxin-like family protein [Owenweeksia sp.]|nr:peroxiredoxin-like family protein [Owenweeksia sp.]